MKLIPLQLFVFFLLSCYTSNAQEVSDREWLDLFAKDSLELWKTTSEKKAEIGNLWSIKDGVLHLDKENKGRGGHIVTKKNYFNFELKFDFKMSYNGNSGVKYRTKDGIGCEFQIIDDDHYRDNKNPTHRTACLYDLVEVPKDRKLHPTDSDQWNQGRIVAKGDRIEHWLNGEKVISIRFGSKDWKARFARSKYKENADFAVNPGPILLQDHGDSVSYRNMLIRELKVESKKPPTKVATSSTKNKTVVKEPIAFTANCKACHMLDQALVGPSLVELAELYPKKDLPKFIKWCVDPGKKRPQMAQMPSMAHIPEQQLIEIYTYIKKVTIGVNKVKTSKIDPFLMAPATTQRPRVIRTFVPESGPASIVVALPTKDKLNVIWDTAQCRLRYISKGTFDNWPYLRSNGNALAKVGDIIYREQSPVFTSSELVYKGYRLSADGLPVFIYTVDGVAVEESIQVTENDGIQRRLKSESPIKGGNLPKLESEGLTTTSSADGGVITINHTR